MEYLVTYYVKNTNSAKDIFNVIPYASSLLTGSENEVLELVASKLKKNPFFRCCSVMDHCSGNKKVFETKFILDNPHFKEDALQTKFKVLEQSSRFWNPLTIRKSMILVRTSTRRPVQRMSARALK